MLRSENLLIIGIDPGTTLAYAILDLDGNLVKIKSSKQLTLSSLIFEILRHGKAILVGTDKLRTPNFIENFAAKTGSKLIHPNYDLSVNEKRRLTSKYKLKNEHERDALASAIFTFKKFKASFRKIDSYLKKQNKIYLRNKVKEICIKDGKSIAGIINDLEKIDARKEKKKRRKTGISIKLKRNEIESLKEKNEELLNKINTLEREKDDLINKPVDFEKKIKNLVRFKDERINYLNNLISNYKEEVLSLKKELDNFKKYLFEIDKYIFIKKIKNLGWEEVFNKDFEKILFVENTDIFGEKSLNFLKGKVEIIITKEPNKNLKDRFIFLNYKNLVIKEEEDFVLVDKNNLENELNKVNLLNKIIKEYKDERAKLLHNQS